MNNLTKTDHASTLLGFFASKTVLCRHSNADLRLAAWLPSRLAAKKSAFTLAEVLITLGIIGVVAALTIPSIVSHFRKKEVETKVAHFYSVMNQAIAQSEVENGPKDTWWQNFSCSSGAYSEKCLQDFFDKYYKNVLKYTKIEYSQSSVNTQSSLNIFLPNGSIIAMGYIGHDYLLILSEKAMNNKIRGKNCFLFGFYPNGAAHGEARYLNFKNKGMEPYVYEYWTGEYDDLWKSSLSHAKILQLNNWKIPNNYPYKF